MTAKTSVLFLSLIVSFTFKTIFHFICSACFYLLIFYPKDLNNRYKDIPFHATFLWSIINHLL